MQFRKDNQQAQGAGWDPFQENWVSVLNSQDGNLGCSVTPARTSGISSTQGIG